MNKHKRLKRTYTMSHSVRTAILAVAVFTAATSIAGVGYNASGSSPAPTQVPTTSRAARAALTTAAPFLAYSADSYYKSLVNPAKINPTATAQLKAFTSTFVDQKGTPYPLLNGVGSNKWGMVYADGKATDPVWHLKGTSVPARLGVSGSGFHAASYLGQMLTGTSDSPFVVFDVASGITVVGTKASAGAGNIITVQSGGYFVHTSNGLDRKRPESNSTVNTASRGRIPDSMVVRKDAMDNAIANHTDLGYVLEIFWAETNSASGFKFPMTGAEGGQAGWGAEGQRIAISPTVNLAARNCSPVALAIALTLQRHGAYIGDNAGGAAALKMQQESSAHPVWGSSVTQKALAGCVTWNDFVAVDN